MRVDPQLAREAARLAAAMLAVHSLVRGEFALSAAPAAAGPPAPGTTRVTVPPELLGLDFQDALAGGRGHALYARAAGSRMAYDGPVRPVDIRV